MEFPFLQWRRGRLAAAALRQQVFPHCASADCPRRSHTFPVYWMRSSGTEFDGRWYCSTDCLQRSVRLAVQNHISRFLLERPRSYRLPLGLLLVNRGQITRSEEHTSELQSPCNLVCRLLLEKKKKLSTHRPTAFQP